jgi:hypothetical protein
MKAPLAAADACVFQPYLTDGDGEHLDAAGSACAAVGALRRPTLKSAAGWLRPSLSAAHIPRMNLELSDEEAAALIRELHDIIESDKYPFSPRIRALRAILAKLRPESVREPLPPLKVYDPPRSSAARRRGFWAPLTTCRRRTASNPDRPFSWEEKHARTSQGVRRSANSRCWRVEWEDEDGGVEVTIFSGPDARDRAFQYAGWRYRGATPAQRVKSTPGPSMTWGAAEAAGVRLIVWCRACRRQVEPDPLPALQLSRIQRSL